MSLFFTKKKAASKVIIVEKKYKKSFRVSDVSFTSLHPSPVIWQKPEKNSTLHIKPYFLWRKTVLSYFFHLRFGNGK